MGRKRLYSTVVEEHSDTSDSDDEEFAPVKLARQRKSSDGMVTPRSKSRQNSRPSKPETVEPRVERQEEILDEQSMQPVVFHPEPNVTPSKRHRADSFNEWVDDMNISSQQSLDLAGFDVNSQESRERFLDKFTLSQTSFVHGGSLKLARSDTQATDGALIEENSLLWTSISVSSQ